MWKIVDGKQRSSVVGRYFKQQLLYIAQRIDKYLLRYVIGLFIVFYRMFVPIIWDFFLIKMNLCLSAPVYLCYNIVFIHQVL